MTVIVVVLLLFAVGYLITVKAAAVPDGFPLVAVWDRALHTVRPQRRTRRIAARAMSAVFRDVVIGVRGDVLVRNRIRVQLSDADHAVLEPIGAWFCADVAAAVEADVAKRGWKLNGPITVTIEPSSLVPDGRPHVIASFAAGVAPTAVDDAVQTAPGGPNRAATVLAAVVLTLGDRHIPLQTGRTVTVGRGDDCGVVVDDPMVSHRHCTVAAAVDTAIVVDTGSSNGTWVNDQPVHRTRVNDGDVLRVGHTSIVVHAASSDRASGGLAATEQLL